MTGVEYKVGDVLVSIFSYNMTFVKFFKITSVSKTGKTVEFRRLLDDIVESSPHGFTGTVIARDRFDRNDTQVRKCRATSAPAIWDGTPQYFNSLD